MDIGVVRGLVTLALLVAFVAICAWAWSASRKSDFEEAARLPFDEADNDGSDGR